MFCLCRSMKYMFEMAPAPRIWACHGPTQQLHISPQPDCTTVPPVTWLHHYMFICFKGFLVDVEAWAVCMSTLSQVVCTPAIPLIA
jgi:hypothetical protein